MQFFWILHINFEKISFFTFFILTFYETFIKFRKVFGSLKTVYRPNHKDYLCSNILNMMILYFCHNLSYINQVLFSNQVTLKLLFFGLFTIMLHHEWLQGCPYVMSRPTQIPSFIISLSFLKLKKKQRYPPTHDTSTHVFKQLNQIVRFK